MRRRPREDDEEEQQRLERDVARDRRPAEHRRHRTGSAADHDVLRRGGLEQHGVDDRVAHERAEREPHRERVHRVPEDREAEAAHGAREEQDLRRRDRAHDGRTSARARHRRVDLLLHEAIERRGRARDQRDAHRREDDAVRGAATPGAARSIPITAVKTMREYDARLREAPELHADAGCAGCVEIVRWSMGARNYKRSADLRRLEQALQVPEHAPAGPACGRPAHHHVAVWDPPGRCGPGRRPPRARWPRPFGATATSVPSKGASAAMLGRAAGRPPRSTRATRDALRPRARRTWRMTVSFARQVSPHAPESMATRIQRPRSSRKAKARRRRAGRSDWSLTCAGGSSSSPWFAVGARCPYRYARIGGDDRQREERQR